MSPSTSGRNRLAEKSEDRLDRSAGKIADHPIRTLAMYGFGALGVLIGIILVITAIFGVIQWVSSWGSEGKRIVGVTNVREQHTAIIQDWQSLLASADNACAAQDVKQVDGAPTLVEDPAAAYASTYRRIVADYNRRQANIFEAGVPHTGPSGYPNTVPAIGSKPDWCTVSDSLRAIHD